MMLCISISEYMYTVYVVCIFHVNDECHLFLNRKNSKSKKKRNNKHTACVYRQKTNFSAFKKICDIKYAKLHQPGNAQQL